MSYSLRIPNPPQPDTVVPLAAGDQLFLLGANGSGKSSLMHRLYAMNRNHARYVAAHRPNWFASSELTLSPQQRKQTENHLLNADFQPQARWKDDYWSQRVGLALYDLVDAENSRARRVTTAVDVNDLVEARRLVASGSPLSRINELLKGANLPVRIDIRSGEELRAIRIGGHEYGVSELSDGERNALLVAASVLTAKPGVLILIDEPERHLHRSIISPLLTALFAERPDCSFVVSTHEIMLPLDNPKAQTLLVRSCSYTGSAAAGWDVDLLPLGAEVDDQIKREILGARRTVLFVEGDQRSLDLRLYSVLFPESSVVPKQSCHDVERAVHGARAVAALHWLRAFGIVDRDGRSDEDVDRLATEGIHALSVFSVESVYYHPTVQLRIAVRHAAVLGKDATVVAEAAANAALEAVAQHADRLSERASERRVREAAMKQLPRREDIVSGGVFTARIDIGVIVSSERARLSKAIQSRDLATIFTGFPVRETPALDAVARGLGFQGRSQYEDAVVCLLRDDRAALSEVQALFEPLTGALRSQGDCGPAQTSSPSDSSVASA